MVEQTDPGRPEGQSGQAADVAGQDTVHEWLELGKQAGTAASTFGKLLGAELKLAGADIGRLFAVGLALLSLVSIAWLGLSVLLSWLAYEQVQSVTSALLVFLGIQVLAILLLVKAAKTFKRSLSLPATKRNFRAIIDSAASTSTEDPQLKETTDGAQRPSA